MLNDVIIIYIIKNHKVSLFEKCGRNGVLPIFLLSPIGLFDQCVILNYA